MCHDTVSCQLAHREDPDFGTKEQSKKHHQLGAVRQAGIMLGSWKMIKIQWGHTLKKNRTKSKWG